MRRSPVDGPLGFVTLAGQVTSVAGGPAAPTSFILQLPARAVDVRIGPRTRFTARSAEALVDGFTAHDFAVVRAHRTTQGLTAVRVVYDLIPFGPIHRFTITGTVMRIALSGRAFQIKLAGGATHWIAITPRSQLLVNGAPATEMPAQRGETATVTVRSLDTRWVALIVDLGSGSS